MADRAAELRAILSSVRARWTRRAVLRSWALGATTAAAMLGVGLLAVWLIAPQGLPLVIVVGTVGVVVGITLSFALLPLKHLPSDRQIARFIEEQAGDLDEVLVTAIDKSHAGSGPVVDLIVADAVRAASRVDAQAIITRDTLRRAFAGAAAGTLAFAVAFWLFAPSASRAINVVGSYLVPARYEIEVHPGSAKVREGQSLTVRAKIVGIDGGLVPAITVGEGDAARTARLAPGASPGEFAITLHNITTPFSYVVTAGSASSTPFKVDVIRPVRIARIDVSYDYAPEAGLKPHTEHDGGDIFAPAGTKVRLTITADKPVAAGAVTLDEGTRIELTGHNQVWNADLTVSKDGSYRIALNDVDGLSNSGSEYFIRMLNDRPPEVRILRPAGDKQVSPLEEVVIEARADDDYGVRGLELVIKSAAGKERVVPLGPFDARPATKPGDGRAQGEPVLTAAHTVYLEDLQVKPGDVVTYHARATDVGRGRRSIESRSDIFFLEVKPYEEEFVAAESQGSGMSGAQQTGLEELIAQQKDIMAATWKLDARSRRGGAGAQSATDIRAIGQAQTTLQNKTAEVAAEILGQLQAQRRRLGPQGRLLTRPGDEPLPKAIEAMGRAAGELDKLRLAQALPHEEQALAELLRAAAEIRRRMIAMQQARGGGGDGNRHQPDLSTLFDQELRKRQATNYEQQSTTQESQTPEQQENDPLAAIRELARRQEALSKQQRDLANNKDQLSADDVKRQLERLTREQEELRRQAEALSQQMRSQQGGRQSGEQGSRGSSGSSGSNGSASTSQQLRDASEQMRQAAGDLRNQDPRQASARGGKAGEQLRGVEQQLQGARPEERRRAMGDLQLEARQLADSQRRLATETSKAIDGDAAGDARRRLAAEQERLADRAQRLGESVKQLASGTGDAQERQAIAEAGRELDRQNVPGRMRESAQSIRQGRTTGGTEPAAGGRETGAASRPGDEADRIARALDKVAEHLGSANTDRDTEAAKLSEQLGRAQELRDRLSRLDRAMTEANKSPQGGQASPGAGGAPGGEGPARAGDQQRGIDQQIREAQELAKEIGGTTPEQWQRSVSAPGTEGFKQDFAKWEELKKHLLVALEKTESQLSDQLRARETRERLNAGRHEGVADTYRDLVDRYYRSLAVPRKSSR
ncbi:MAG TPA: DUF4175 family protein [Vicinamibacterales bacterium]|nr:DUF4175 family protein [Vicinamibacterales bacterium]